MFAHKRRILALEALVTALERLNGSVDNLTLAVSELASRATPQPPPPADGLTAGEADAVAARIDDLTTIVNATLPSQMPPPIE